MQSIEDEKYNIVEPGFSGPRPESGVNNLGKSKIGSIQQAAKGGREPVCDPIFLYIIYTIQDYL